MNNILRKPNPWPQSVALARTEEEILYGWARWGGKTDAGIAWLTRWINNPLLRALVLRETYDDLSDWIDRAMHLYQHFGAKKTGIPVTIEFPSGAKIRTGYLKGQSYDKYKWHEYQKIIIEELTQIPSEEMYEKLLWSRRSTVEGLTPQIFCTTNPDGIGRLRVKRRFVDVADPWVTYTDQQGNRRIYIPARIEDNPVLIQKDPWYMKYLDGIKDEQLRRAWREWDRDAYDIKWAIYIDQLKQIRTEQRITTIRPEEGISVHTARDIGIDDSTTIIFFQVVGKEIRIIDTHKNRQEWIDYYTRILKEKWYEYGYHLLPHDARHKSKNDGKTYEEYLKESLIKYGVGWEVAVIKKTTDIWLDIAQVRQMLAYMWFNRETTHELIDHIEIYRQKYDETLGVFSHKPVHGEESHYADALRYLVMWYLEHLVQTTSSARSYSANVRRRL